MTDAFGNQYGFFCVRTPLGECPKRREAPGQKTSGLHGKQGDHAEAVTEAVAFEAVDDASEVWCRVAIVANTEGDLAEEEIRGDLKAKTSDVYRDRQDTTP